MWLYFWRLFSFSVGKDGEIATPRTKTSSQVIMRSLSSKALLIHLLEAREAQRWAAIHIKTPIPPDLIPRVTMRSLIRPTRTIQLLSYNHLMYMEGGGYQTDHYPTWYNAIRLHSRLLITREANEILFASHSMIPIFSSTSLYFFFAELFLYPMLTHNLCLPFFRFS